MHPTPTSSMMTAADMEQAKTAGNSSKRPKYQDANKYPTPTTRPDGTGSLGRSIQKRIPTPTATDAIKGGKVSPRPGAMGLSETTGGSLNPDWVEWLMGWPIGWTGLRPLETGRFQKWLELHGKY